eukprot:CCRYP_018520-RA/>CCRYP_018520-RA protein AED:0.44 eAED:0.44 QI:0/-1/0/1/-1/1/1/0/143
MCKIQFVLVVDDLGIKYLSKADLDHLISSLKKYYGVALDMEGKEFVKIELDWENENRKVNLSMKPYLKKALRQFDNIVPSKRYDSPYPHTKTVYGAKEQFAEYDSLPPVKKEEQKHVQKANEIFCGMGEHATEHCSPLSALAA